MGFCFVHCKFPWVFPFVISQSKCMKNCLVCLSCLISKTHFTPTFCTLTSPSFCIVKHSFHMPNSCKILQESDIPLNQNSYIYDFIFLYIFIFRFSKEQNILLDCKFLWVFNFAILIFLWPFNFATAIFSVESNVVCFAKNNVQML